jgi:putative chitinase
MNIHELDSYNLGDAVKFHRRLNPRIWGRDEHLLPEVRERLLAIAADFQEFLGVDDLNVEDITISGSNAAYSYTKNSDIDLHLVVEMPADPVYQELFAAKKYQYNDEHNIRIGGADVELYVQPADQPHISQGIYSVKNSDWISIPQRKRARIDDACVRDKVADLDARIHDAVRSGDESKIATLADKIKAMRQAGLEQQGEFGCENLAFKMLRNSGCIKLLWDARRAAQDRELSLREAPAQPFRYGYGSEVDEASLANMRATFAADAKPQKQEVFHSHDEYEKVKKQREAEREEKIKHLARKPMKPWSGGLEEGMQSQPYSTSDGVAASTKQFLEDSNTETNLVQEFIQHTATELGIDPLPEIHLHTDPAWSTNNHSFGRYDPDSHTLNVSMPNRHILDVLRTVAHELVHCSQNQQHGQLPDDAGETGSRWENDANARAGIIMRDWANSHPEHFELPALGEGASGYIPKNKKEAARPQYAMALSVDIKPGQTGKEANKLALNTGRNGEPGLLMKTVNLREYKMPQPSHGPGKIKDLNEPLGPETPPTMPAGTVKVDVSDVYDWYKLGQHISNMKGLGQHDFGQGPPSAILSFGDEDLEHQYIQALKKTGLTTTDIDPVDPDQPPGMPRQKTDPTYNVDEDMTRRGFVRGVGAAAGLAATGAGAKQLRDYEPRSVPHVTQIVDAPDAFAAETQQLLHDKYVYNRLTKDAFLKMRALPDYDSVVELEQVFSQPMNSKVTLMFNHSDGRGYWVTPTIFDTIRKEIEAGQLLAKSKRPGGVPMAKDPLATDRLPNSMRQSAPPTPGEEQDRAYRGIGANQPTESLDEDWRTALATGAMAGAMAMGAQAKAPDMVQQIVEPGDTVYSIARQTGADPKEIYRLNKMDRNTKLEIGQRVLVPDYSKPIKKLPATVTPTVKPPVAQAAPPSLKDKISSIIPKFSSDDKEEEGVTLLSDNTDAEAALQTAAKAAGLKGSELAQFMAQTRHESWDFGKMKEVGNQKTFAKYDAPRKARQLGNKAKGDGERFKGRGFIQLTGRDNYTRASQQIFGDDRLVKNPDLASRLDVGAQIALWFWKSQVRPNVSNFNNTKEVTNAINPGLSGLQDRHTKFKEYMAVL